MLIYLQIPLRPFANRHGAAAARGAHNSEVTGSKPVAGMTFLLFQASSKPAQFLERFFQFSTNGEILFVKMNFFRPQPYYSAAT
jgi:hypothetical protein